MGFWGLAIPAIGNLLGSWLFSRGSGKSADLQYRAVQDAQRWQEKMYRDEQERLAEERALEQARHDAYQRMREPYRMGSLNVLRGWGYDVPDDYFNWDETGAPYGAPPTEADGMTPLPANLDPQRLAELPEALPQSAIPPVEAVEAVRRLGFGNLGGWRDWRGGYRA